MQREERKKTLGFSFIFESVEGGYLLFCYVYGKNIQLLKCLSKTSTKKTHTEKQRIRKIRVWLLIGSRLLSQNNSELPLNYPSLKIHMNKFTDLCKEWCCRCPCVIFTRKLTWSLPKPQKGIVCTCTVNQAGWLDDLASFRTVALKMKEI